jgi:hypothetical protein
MFFFSTFYIIYQIGKLYKNVGFAQLFDIIKHTLYYIKYVGLQLFI